MVFRDISFKTFDYNQVQNHQKSAQLAINIQILSIDAAKIAMTRWIVVAKCRPILLETSHMHMYKIINIAYLWGNLSLRHEHGLDAKWQHLTTTASIRFVFKHDAAMKLWSKQNFEGLSLAKKQMIESYIKIAKKSSQNNSFSSNFQRI